MTAPHEEEFLDFYQAYWPRLVAALSLVVPEGEDPEDVAQEAFARAYQHWPKVRSHERPDAWLFLTAYRLVTTIRRRLVAARRRQQIQRADAAYELVSDSEVGDLLAGLPMRQRAAIVLRHYYGLSTRETAAAMRCREGTVKSLVQRARVTLKGSILGEEGER